MNNAKQTSHPESGAEETMSEEEMKQTTTEGGPAAEETADSPDEAIPNDAQSEIEQQQEEQAAEIAALKDKLLRTLADVENMRRRSARDKEDAHNYAITKFARDILGVSDNLRRALDSIPAEARENEEVKHVVTGVEMTESELLNVFEQHKIKKVEPMGEKFDPNLHQAMFEVENPSVEPGTVIQVVQSGYVIADRLLRPAMVGVAKGGQKKSDIKVDEKA